ncbi:MAG: hypothetical protein M1308_17365, partial [Actinobacteria bacterium]|nr:hypothetical protein [Actinomycetota bacterium]
LITYSIETDADFSSNDLPQNTILPGAYNRQNMLAAYAVSEILQIDRKVSSKTISEFQGLRGRFEYVENNRGFKIIVDFAHKPNAFDAVLDTMRLMNKQGRLIIMFGSAGERDKLKRPMMGEIAGAKADISVITAEDPRSEDVNDINESISKGLIKSGAKEFKKTVYEFDNNKYFIRIPDRKEAIDTIINKIAQPGDIIAFLGKSHEKSMCYGKKEYPWNEFEEIKKALDAN